MKTRLALVGLTTVLAASAGAQFASYQQLTPARNVFKTFSADYWPTGLSKNGTTMVGSYAQGWFYYTLETGPVQIGGVWDGADNGRASDDGMRIGATIHGAPNAYTPTGWDEMAIYDRATHTWTSYGSLNHPNGSVASTTWGISGDGHTVLGQAYYSAGAPGSTGIRVNPCIGQTPGGPLINLHPNTSNNGRVSASNSNGTVCGGFDAGLGTIWVNGVAQTMQTTISGVMRTLAAVEDVSANGRWIVGDGSSASLGAPYLYDRTNNTYLFAPNPYAIIGSSAVVISVSNNGSLVFGRYLQGGHSPFTDSIPFIWNTTTNTLTLLSDLVAQAGVNTGNLKLTLPIGMSNDGKTFVGFAATTSGTPTIKSYFLRLNRYVDKDVQP